MIKGDRIKLVNKMGVFTNVGEICEVVDVTQEGVISFKFGNGMHLGCMSYDEFKKHFELVEKASVWTEWKPSLFRYKEFGILMINIEMPMEVRTNGKIVEARFKYMNCECIKSQVTCQEDKFSFEKGEELAKRKLIVEILKNKTEHYAASL